MKADILAKCLNTYGTLLDLSDDEDRSLGLKTGVKTAIFENLKEEIPSYLYVGKISVRVSYKGQTKTCRNCGQTGHEAKDCQAGRVCKICGSPDHTKGQCPQRRCFACGEKGHEQHECPNYNHEFPPLNSQQQEKETEQGNEPEEGHEHNHKDEDKEEMEGTSTSFTEPISTDWNAVNEPGSETDWGKSSKGDWSNPTWKDSGKDTEDMDESTAQTSGKRKEKADENEEHVKGKEASNIAGTNPPPQKKPNNKKKKRPDRTETGTSNQEDGKAPRDQTPSATEDINQAKEIQGKTKGQTRSRSTTKSPAKARNNSDRSRSAIRVSMGKSRLPTIPSSNSSQ